MVQNKNQKSCAPNLCSVCGPNINTDDVDFSMKEANLVYMDKVYSYNKAVACPLLTQLPETARWKTELLLKKKAENCGNVCENDCVLTPDAVFTVSRSYIIVSGAAIDDCAVTSDNVTVDGVAVDSIVRMGNKYIASTDSLNARTGREKCMELGLPSKNFFLITDAGPWLLNATIVLEGTVNTGGKTCCFQAKFYTPDEGLKIKGESTFAVPKLSIPCSINGVSPSICFSFTGRSYILNPDIKVNGCGTNVSIELTGSIALQPQLNVEVIRRTLFCIDACEAMIPCDGTEAAYEIDNDDECEWPPKPACSCGNKKTPANDPECYEEKDECSCTPNPCQWNGCNGISW